MTAPPGSTPVPGTVVVTAPPPAAPLDTTTINPLAATAPAAVATTSPSIGEAQIIVSPPSTMRLVEGPYTVPISVTSASRLSMVSLTLTFDPTKLRARSVQ